MPRVLRGMGAAADAIGAPGSAGPGSLPWYCHIPGYALLTEKSASQCNIFGATPNPPTPATPVIPAGSLDPNQGPATVGSPDQVVGDTAAAQRQQVQDFFTQVAAQSNPGTPGSCAVSDFWCNYGLYVFLAGLAGFLWFAKANSR